MADEEEENVEEQGGDAGEDGADADGEGDDEGGDGEGGEGEDGEGGGSKKLIIIIAGVVVLLIAVGAGLFFTGMLDGVLGKEEECVEEVDEHGKVIHECPEEEHAEDQGDGHGEKKAKKKDDGHGGGGHGDGDSAFVEIPTLTVNLLADDGSPRYLRLSVQLELDDPSDKAAVEAVMPRVIDQFQTYLRELRVRDLRGSAGIYRLQMELLWRVNQAAAPVEVKDVLFQEILIQ